MPADSLSATFFALADPTRRQILARLTSGDATVNELAEPHEMTRAAVSKHLKVLEAAGLISKGKDAQRRPCHLEAAPLQEISDWLDAYQRFWEHSFESLKEYVKTMQRPPSRKRGRRRRIVR